MTEFPYVELHIPCGPEVIKKRDVGVSAFLGKQVIDASDVSQPKLFRPTGKLASFFDGPFGVRHEIVS
jgi:hypothetical protein